MTVLCSWTNGKRAVVNLVQNEAGEKYIHKIYYRGHSLWMLREYANAKYLSSRLSIVPRLISFHYWHRELVFSYIPGQRVFEWVLERFGDPGLQLDEFLNFEPMYTDERVTSAFAYFRNSSSPEAINLKQAIKESYGELHRIGFQHGTCDPRNIIYDGQRVFIIDFDHARPGLNPGKYDYPELAQWFGVTPCPRTPPLSLFGLLI